MVEENETKEETEDPKEDNSLIDDLNKATERMEEATKERNKTIEKEENLIVEKRLGGKSDAGEPTPEEKKESDVEFANNLGRMEENLMFPEKK